MLIVDHVPVASLEVAGSRAGRTRGLLGRNSLEGALWLPGVRSVHTFGMRFAIDVAWLGRNGRVSHVATMSPWRLSAWRPGLGVIEAEGGSFEAWGLTVGSQVGVRPDISSQPVGLPASGSPAG